MLCGTTFRNCIFKGTIFSNADLKGCKFKQCDLTAADFTGAKRISTVKIEDSIIDGVQIALLTGDALVKFMVDHGLIKNRANVADTVKKKVFFSRLGLMDSQQQLHYEGIKCYLEAKYPNIEVVTIEREDYKNMGQLTMIKDKIDICYGAVIFAFAYMRVQDGVIHENLSGEDKIQTINCTYPSPWIQIEAAFANAKSLPSLIIVEDHLQCDGIFDEKVSGNDNLMFRIPYSGRITKESDDVISRWWNQVEKVS